MKCVIPGANVKSMLFHLGYVLFFFYLNNIKNKIHISIVKNKYTLVLAKAIHALSKIGEEMYIEPQDNVLSFRTVNMANSAYADFTFFQCYFSYYIYGDLQENDALKCKISMRVIRYYILI